MQEYLLYITIASVTIASPGPGVILTISNSLKFGFAKALYGIFGVAMGMFFVAVISATSLGVILATSALAFTVLKYMGAAYLIYLGIKMWRSTETFKVSDNAQSKNNRTLFLEGISITLLNPKPIFFFMALFPQFIHPSSSYVSQFLVLVLTFSFLVVSIHCLYSYASKTVRTKLTSRRGSTFISKISGGFFMCFGIGLAASNK